MNNNYRSGLFGGRGFPQQQQQPMGYRTGMFSMPPTGGGFNPMQGSRMAMPPPTNGMDSFKPMMADANSMGPGGPLQSRGGPMFGPMGGMGTKIGYGGPTGGMGGDYGSSASAMYARMRQGMGGDSMAPDMGNKMMQQPPAPPAMYASGAPMGGGGGLQFDAQGNVIRPGIPPSQPLGDPSKTGPVTPQEIHNGQFDPASSPTYLQGPTASLFGGAGGPPPDPRMVWGMGNAGGMRGYNLVPGWNGYK